MLGRLLAWAGAAVLLVAALMFSLLAFAVLLAVGAVVGGWLWWKTRHLRREIERQLRQRPPGGRVIEGEVIREPRPEEPPLR